MKLNKQIVPPSAKKVFTGIIFDVYQWEQKLFDGTTTTFEAIDRPNTVVIIPILNDGSILISKQQQPGKEPYLGLFGGRVDKEENTEEAARREFLEESGYQAEQLILWDEYHPANKIDWIIYTYIAKGIKKVQNQNLDAGEKVALQEVSFDEFVDLALQNNFSDDPQIRIRFLEAKLDQSKMEELKKLFGA